MFEDFLYDFEYYINLFEAMIKTSYCMLIFLSLSMIILLIFTIRTHNKAERLERKVNNLLGVKDEKEQYKNYLENQNNNN